MWTRVAIVFVIVLAVLLVAGNIALHRAGPILKARIVETLSSRFHSRVTLDRLDASLLHGLEISASGLRIDAPQDVVAAGENQPLIAIAGFSFHAGLAGFFVEPMRVGTVKVEGLQIHIPPREMRRGSPEPSAKHAGKMKIVVDEIVCDHSQLVIDTSKPDKSPKRFELKHIELHDVGPDAPWRYDARLTNAIPRGEIHASGAFGPWQTESPGDSSVTGHYTFDHADLNTIKGISGTLSSTGGFQGQLNRIVVDGTTETPDFSLDTANRPVPLHTRFHAIVDGITGDTYLQPVSAQLGNSSFTTSGSVIDTKGVGHTIQLDVDVPQGRIQDFLDLAVKSRPAVMTGIIATKAKLGIRPGKERVAQKLTVSGNFTLQSIHFTNPTVEDKVDMMSMRAQGQPRKARPGARDVASHMSGTFSLQEGVIHFSKLDYVLPGARVNLDGVYSLDGEQFDFHGNVHTAVPLSKMVDSPWLSFLLHAARPFFGKGNGADIPVHISGTKSAPKFGLDVLRRH